MEAARICSRDVVTVPERASLLDVATLMRERHVGMVVVTRTSSGHRKVAGIITDRDIVHAQLARPATLSSLYVADFMTLDPLTVAEDDPVADAIERMRLRSVRRAPVLTSSGDLVGIISTDDLIGHVAWELGTLARAVERQPRLEVLQPEAKTGDRLCESKIS